jgi:hypothetical protein
MKLVKAILFTVAATFWGVFTYDVIVGNSVSQFLTACAFILYNHWLRHPCT